MPRLYVNLERDRLVESVTVAFRLKPEVWARYSDLAQHRGQSLGAYMRERLEDLERLEAEVVRLRQLLESAVQRPATDGHSQSVPPGAFLEMLLLLRSMAGPQNCGMVQKEVERQGLEDWKY
jgi:hypothetical protein